MEMKTALACLAAQFAIAAVLFQRYGQGIVGLYCGFELESELLLYSKRVVTGDEVIEATVHIKDGEIEAVIPSSDVTTLQSLQHLKRIDYGDLVISPSFIDTHVHLSEPGLDQREGISRATKSAVRGGVTTVVEMPMPCSPPTTSCQRLKGKIFRFKMDAFSSIGSWAGLVPENVDDEETLRCLVHVTGAFGLHSNLADDGTNLHAVNLTHVAKAITTLKKLGATYSIQAQLRPNLQVDEEWLEEQEQAAVNSILEILMNDAENPGVPGFRVHFTHIRLAKSIDLISQAKTAGLPVSVEIAPHYLYFDKQEATSNSLLKVLPPIGNKQNQKELWTAVKKGDIDTIASDHMPCMPSEKLNGYRQATPGISSVQYLLPLIWNGITDAKTENSELILLSNLLSKRPAELLGLSDSKGAIAKGFAADIVVWDPEGLADMSEGGCHLQNPKLCPYLDKALKGAVRATWMKGNLVFDHKRGRSWSSCRKIYGLGEWAKCTVFWFYEVSFAE